MKKTLGTTECNGKKCELCASTILKKLISFIVAFAIMFNLPYGAFDIKAEAVDILRTPIEKSEADAAVAWAKNYYTNNAYNNYYDGFCFLFINDAYGSVPNYSKASMSNAKQARDLWQCCTDKSVIPPKGALCFYDYGTLGHIGISDGTGKVYHAAKDKKDPNGKTIWYQDYQLSTWNMSYTGWGTFKNYSLKYSDPNNLYTPTVTFDKTTYNIGDTVNVSWNAAPTGDALDYYWIDVIDPDGNNPIDVRNDKTTSFSFVPEKAGTYKFRIYMYAYGNVMDTKLIEKTVVVSNGQSSGATKKITDAKHTLSFTSATYTGSEIKPTLKLTYNGTTLKENTDYTISYVNNVNAGTGSIIVIGKGNYTGSMTLAFVILKKSLSSSTVSSIADQYYTGSAIKPSVTVKDGTKTLVNNTDYTLSYSNNTNVGTATVTITGKGNYSGTKTATFKIVSKTTSGTSYDKQLSDGNEIDTVLSLILNQNNNTVRAGKTKKDMISYLLYDSQYAVFGGQNWPVTVNGNPASSVTDNNLKNIDGTTSIALDTESWASMAFGWFASGVVYTESVSQKSTRVYFEGTAGSYNTDTIKNSIKTNLQAGEHLRVSDIFSLCYVSCDDNGFYYMQYGSEDDSDKHIRLRYSSFANFVKWLNSTGKEFWYYTIDNDTNTTKSISGATISAIANQTYTGSAIKPSVTVKDGSTTLTNGTHYTVSYSNNTNVGTATVTITGKGNYTGTKTATFKIVAKSISGATISAIANQTYTGSAIKPAVTVKDGTTTLTNNTHYTVAYSNNTNVGTATVTITGKGNYTGTKTVTFKIVAKSISGATISAIANQTYTGSAIKPSVTVKDGTTTLTNNTHYTVAYSNNTNVGTATVTITGKGNYTGTKTATFKIVAKAINGVTVSAIADQTYTGSSIKPAVTVKDGSATLTNGTHYTASYSNNTNIGTATVTITGKGNYTGAKTTTFKIVADAIANPENISTSFASGKVTIAWNSVVNATNYRVYRSSELTGTKVLLDDITATTYEDDSITGSTTYYYFVTSYNKNTDVESGYSDAASVTIPAAPTMVTNVKALSGGGNATITWDAVSNATSYRVFRSTSLTGTRTLEKVRTSTYYIDTNVDTGKTYYYWVMAYNANTGLKSAYSAYSSVKIVDTFATSIEIKSASVLSTSVTLKWDMIPGATSYRIYRRNDDGTRSLLYAQSMTEYKDTGLTKGKAYKYEIRGYSATTGALTAYSAIKQVRPMAAPTITSGNVKGKITWDKNAVATSYRVYRADSLTGAKKLLAPTTLLTYTDTTAVKGKTYYYFVAAYDNTTGTLSAYSNAKAIKIS